MRKSVQKFRAAYCHHFIPKEKDPKTQSNKFQMSKNLHTPSSQHHEGVHKGSFKILNLDNLLKSNYQIGVLTILKRSMIWVCSCEIYWRQNLGVCRPHGTSENQKKNILKALEQRSLRKSPKEVEIEGLWEEELVKIFMTFKPSYGQLPRLLKPLKSTQELRSSVAPKISRNEWWKFTKREILKHQREEAKGDEFN